MLDNEDGQFIEALTAALGVYSKEVSPMVINIWWEALKKYDLNAVLNAFSKHIQDPDNGKFAPKPADMIKIIDGGTEDRALAAWSKVDRTIRMVGTYESVVFDDYIIHKVLQEMGGWISLGTKTDDEWPFVRNEFVKRYRGILASGNTDYPKQLIGISQASNDREGQKSQPPKLIGDANKAMEVLTHGSSQTLKVTTHNPSTFKQIGSSLNIKKIDN